MSQVRVSENAYDLLQSISAQQGTTMLDVIDKALEDYNKKLFLEGFNEDIEKLRKNPEAWKEHQEEMEMWDQTVADGLDNV